MAKRGFWADIEEEAMVRTLKHLGKYALPDVAIETINAPAEAIEKETKKNVKKRLIVRTSFTLNSIKQDRHAKGSHIERMYSRVGTSSPYLWFQDKGGTQKGLNGGPVPIPTVQARISKSRQKALRRKYRISESEKFRPGDFGKSGYERMFVGRPRGGGRPYGLYERGFNNKRLNMLRNLEHDKISVPKTNWWSDPLKKYGTKQFMRSQFFRAAKRRLQKYSGE